MFRREHKVLAISIEVIKSHKCQPVVPVSCLTRKIYVRTSVGTTLIHKARVGLDHKDCFEFAFDY